MVGAMRNHWWEPDSSELRCEIARNLRLREIRQKLKANGSTRNSDANRKD